MGFVEQTASGCAFLKAGLYGPQGSGKTRTAIELACALHEYIESRKPMGFIDSESGSDFIVPLVRERDIRIEVDKTRAFSDLKADMQAAAHRYDILLVDSVSHYWRELMRGYLADKQKKFMRVQDWGPVKNMWEQGFTRPYLDLPVHIIMCGRSANIFEDVEDDDDDKGDKKAWKAVKTGTKMSAEGETGYEPHLLIEMERVYEGGTGVYRRQATVVKERFGKLDGKSFFFGESDKRGYVFDCFLPHIKLLAIGGEHRTIADSDSRGLFGGPDHGSGQSIYTRKRIALEAIEATFTQLLPGTGPKDRSLKAYIVEGVFGTASWTQIEETWRLEPLQDILPVLQHVLHMATSEPIEATSPKAIRDTIAGWREDILQLMAVRKQEATAAAAAAAQENHAPTKDDPPAEIVEEQQQLSLVK